MIRLRIVVSFFHVQCVVVLICIDCRVVFVVHFVVTGVQLDVDDLRKNLLVLVCQVDVDELVSGGRVEGRARRCPPRWMGPEPEQGELGAGLEQAGLEQLVPVLVPLVRLQAILPMGA